MKNNLLRKNLWVPEGLWKEVQDVAADEGLSPSLLIKEAVENYLDNTQPTQEHP